MIPVVVNETVEQNVLQECTVSFLLFIKCNITLFYFLIRSVCVSQMSFKELMKVLGLGTVAFVLGVEGLNWLMRRLRDSRGPLKEVLFFPSPQVCVEHLFIRHKHFPW